MSARASSIVECKGTVKAEIANGRECEGKLQDRYTAQLDGAWNL